MRAGRQGGGEAQERKKIEARVMHFEIELK